MYVCSPSLNNNLLHHRWRPDMKEAPMDLCFQLLELSRMYMSSDEREFAIKQIDNRRTSIGPCSLISLSVEHGVENLFKYSFQRLIKDPLDDLTDKKYTTLDPRIWAAILKAQSSIEMHRRIVACEPPPMMHAPGCTRPEHCNLDWEQSWWNGVGRFLLDGRNPQPYKSAVQRFEELTNIWHVSVGCWRSMVTLLRGGLAFNQEDNYIDLPARRSVQQLLQST